MPKYVIFDLDGTLSDDSWRKKYLNLEDEDIKADWERYHMESKHDLVIESVAEVYRIFVLHGYIMVILTGRNIRWRSQTIEWLDSNDLMFNFLLMRPDDDFTPGAKLKLKMLTVHDMTPKATLLVVDNDERVVEALRSEGYLVLSK